MFTWVLEQLGQIKLIEKGEKIMWEVKNEKENLEQKTNKLTR